MKGWIKKALAGVCCVAMGVLTAVGVAACKKQQSTACTHDWESTVITAATCTTDGEQMLKCKKCGTEKTETVVAPGHDYEETVISPATCNTYGESHVACKNCDDERTKTVPQLQHNYVKDEDRCVALGCTTDEITVYACEYCDDVQSEVTKKATGFHDTEDAVWNYEAGETLVSGCTYRKTQYTTCNDCGERVEHYDEITKHEYVRTSYTAATCKADGSAVYTCDGCGDEGYTQTLKASALLHAWDNGSTSGNVTTFTCAHDSTHTKTTYSAAQEVEATIPANVLTQANEIQLQNAAIQMDEKVVEQLGGSDVTMKADTLSDNSTATGNMSEEDQTRLANAEIFDLSMTQNGSAVSQFDGEVTVTVPYELKSGEDAEDYGVLYIADDGATQVKEAAFTSTTASFATDHFSYYTVVCLTPAERCELYGHQNDSKVVPASCAVEGYSLESCKRCGTTHRTVTSKPLGHTYEKEVHAPTCTERGYTVNTCSKCSDKYISDYKAVIAHDYKDSVVAPTCQQTGYTKHTCKDCGYSYTDTETEKAAHKYTSGACSVCGAKDPSSIETVSNYYFNLIESVASVEQYYMKADNLRIVDVERSRSGALDYEMITEISAAEFLFGMDENGYFVGKGEAKITTIEREYDSNGKLQTEDKVDMVGKLVMQDGGIYVYANELNLGEEACIYYPQSVIMEQSGMDMAFGMIGMYAEQLNGIFTNMKAVENNKVNDLIGGLVEYVCNVTPTSDGYTYTVNFDRIPELFNKMRTQKITAFIEEALGEGAVEDLCDFAVEALDMKVSALETKIIEAALVYGVKVEEIYAIANSVLEMMMPAEPGEEQITVEAMIEGYKDMTVCEVIDMFMEAEETQKEMYLGMISQVKEMLDTMTVMDLFGGMGGGDRVEDGAKPAAESAESELDEIYAQMVEMVKAYKNITFGFETDKVGNLLGVDVKYNNFNYTAENSNGSTSNIRISGGATIVPNGSYATDYSDAVAKVKGYQAVMTEIEDGMLLGAYEVAKKDGKIYAALPFEEVMKNPEVQLQEESVEYKGELCDKYLVMNRGVYREEYTYILDENVGFQLMEDCHGWVAYEVLATELAAKTCYYVWIDADEEIVGYEMATDVLELYMEDWSEDFRFYYNPTTGETAADSQHKYVLIEKKIAVGCESVGYEVYVCSVCNNRQKYIQIKGHSMIQWKYELMEGSTSCTDGLWEIQYCNACQKEVGRWDYYGGHHIYRSEETVGTAACGDVKAVYSVCPCGESKEFQHIYGGCEFDRIKSEWIEENGSIPRHSLETYRCAVTACSFTYTLERYSKYENCLVTETEIIRLYGNDTTVDKTLTITDSQESHRHGDETESVENGVTIYSSVCDCGKAVRREGYKNDEYGRTTYYMDYVNNYGYEEIYDGCYYEHYDIYADGSRRLTYSGEEHASWERIESTRVDRTCTQYGYVMEECICCHTQKRHNWWPIGHEYDWDSEKELYVCHICGLENANGADGGFVLEDLSDSTTYKVGYFGGYIDEDGYEYRHANVYVWVNYGDGESKVQLENVAYNVDSYRGSGILALDMASLEAALTAEGLTLADAEISVVFQVTCWIYDGDGGEWNEGSFLDYVITLDPLGSAVGSGSSGSSSIK